MGEIKFFGGLLLMTLFVMAILGYVINFQAENSSEVSMLDDATMSGLNDSLMTDMDDLVTDVNYASTGFINSTADESGTDITTKTGGQFKLGIKPIFKTFQSIKNVINEKIFGGNRGLIYFTTMLGVFLSFMAIRYIWKTWKGGNPD